MFISTITGLALEAKIALAKFESIEAEHFYDTGLFYEKQNKLRSAVGISANWFSPIGPFSFVLAKDITSADTDATESFRFQLGTTF